MACVVALGFVMLCLGLASRGTFNDPLQSDPLHQDADESLQWFALIMMCCGCCGCCGKKCSKRRERIGVGAPAAVDATAAETSKRGALRKLGGKQHDQWQPVEVELSASGGLSWTSGSASRDRLAGSQKTLTPEQMLSVAHYSDIGVEHAFEVVSSAKGGKVYKFSAESESECDEWMAAISSVIDLHNGGGGASDLAVASFPNPSSGGEADATAAPFELEAEEPAQVAGGAAAPFEMEMEPQVKPLPEPEPEPEPEFALDAL